MYIQVHKRKSWIVKFPMRRQEPKSATGVWGDSDAPGANRRQREELVGVLTKAWEVNVELGGAACPHNLTEVFLNRLG